MLDFALTYCINQFIWWLITARVSKLLGAWLKVWKGELPETSRVNKPLTLNSLFVSRALAMARAASTPTVFPSNLRACKPLKSWISFTIPSTADGGQVQNGNWDSDLNQQGVRLRGVSGTLKAPPVMTLTWLGIIQLSSLAFVAKLSVFHSSLGQRVGQLCNKVRRHRYTWGQTHDSLYILLHGHSGACNKLYPWVCFLSFKGSTYYQQSTLAT